MSDGGLIAWLLIGCVWAPLSYSGLLARSQKRYPKSAAANFWTDVTCSLTVAVLVFLFFPLGFGVYWLTRGFEQGHQWWRKS